MSEENTNHSVAEAYLRAQIAKEVDIFLLTHSTYTDEELLFVIRGKK